MVAVKETADQRLRVYVHISEQNNKDGGRKIYRWRGEIDEGRNLEIEGWRQRWKQR
jgi:hypothetical protein